MCILRHILCMNIVIEMTRCLRVVVTQHELKLDAPIQKHVVGTLRCFERALQLDDASSKLWIEYGSCAYLIHSHSSRLIKQVLVVTRLLLNSGKFIICFDVI